MILLPIKKHQADSADFEKSQFDLLAMFPDDDSTTREFASMELEDGEHCVRADVHSSNKFRANGGLTISFF